jgi:hypothetical protein
MEIPQLPDYQFIILHDFKIKKPEKYNKQTMKSFM